MDNNSSDDGHDLIIACIGNRELDENVINFAYKKARSYNCPWKILHVKENNPSPNSKKKPSSVGKLIKKAEVLGAEIVYIESPGVESGIISYADQVRGKAKKILFLLGAAPELNLPLLSRRTIYNNIKTELGRRNIKAESVVTDRNNKKYAHIVPIFNLGGILGMMEAVSFVLIASLACIGFDYAVGKTGSFIENGNLYVIYIIACVAAAMRGGMISGLIATVISMVAIHYFFPSANVHSQISTINLLIFGGASVLLSVICSGTRRYIIEARQKEAYLNALLNIGENLNRPLAVNEALSYIHNELVKLFHTEVAFFAPPLMGGSSLVLKFPESIDKLRPEDTEALEKCHHEFISTGFLTSTVPQSSWYFEPMMSANGFEGVLAVRLAHSVLRYDNSITNILLSFADLSATIVDRIESTQVIEDTKIQQEKEKLRTMLLSSVSHDLKTPLASIIGSLDVYHSLYDKLTDENRRALTETAYQEAQRLDSFIVNILDMAKLESGSVKFQKDWHSPKTLFEKVLIHVQPKIGKRSMKYIAESDDHEIELDFNMTLRALTNLFDNIGKYTPEDAEVLIDYGPDGDGGFYLTIIDNGPGIDEDMLEAIFNKYTRIKKRDAKIAGTGLGLPISKHIIESQGGNIVAFNTSPNGAGFKMTFPNFRKAQAKAA